MSTVWWTTSYGSLCEMIRSPDFDGWGKFRRMSDGAVREFHMSEMEPVKEIDTIRESDKMGSRPSE